MDSEVNRRLQAQPAMASSQGTKHLPSDVLAEVAKRLPTDDPVETAKNLKNFQLVSRSARDAVRRTPIQTFLGRLKRLFDAAEHLHDIAIPARGLPRLFEDTPQHEEEGFARAAQRTHAVGPTLKFQHGVRQSAFVSHILDVSPAHNQALTIAAMARHLGDLDDANKNRLVNRAIELFGQDGREWADRECLKHSAHALLVGYDHLNADQKLKILDAMRGHPDLFSICHAESHHLDPSLTSTSRAAAGHEAESPKADLDQKIKDIRLSVAELARGPSEENMSARVQVDAVRPIGKSINEAYKNARADLMAPDRTRECRSLAR